MDSISTNASLQRMLVILGILLGLNLVELIIGYFNQRLQIRVQVRSSTRLIEDITEHLLHVPAMKLETMNTAVVSQKINNDANRVIIFGLNVLIQCPLKLVELVICSWVFCQLSIPFFVLSVCCLLVYWLFFFSRSQVLERREHDYLERQSQYFESFYTWLDQWLVQKFYRVPFFRHQCNDAQNQLIQTAQAQTKTAYRFSAAQSLVQMLPQILLCGFGGWGVMQGRYTIGFFVTCLSYLGNWMASMEYFMGVVVSWKQTQASLNRLKTYIEMPAEASNEADADQTLSGKTPLAIYPQMRFFPQAGVMELDQTSFAYPDGPVLQFPSLHLKKGQLIVLRGPNGSGKSTLLKMLAGLYIPLQKTTGEDVNLESGTVSGSGQAAQMCSLECYRKTFAGYLPQNVFIFPEGADPLVQNMEAKEACMVCGLPWQEMQEILLPDNPESLQNNSSSSQGEKERLALARILAEDKEILLLDEPTNHLDQKSKQWFLSHLSDIVRDRIMVIATHDPQILMQADQIIDLSAGTETPEGK